MLESEGPILQGRYQLVKRLLFDNAQRCEVWAALESPGQNDESPCLIRAWPFGDGSGHNEHDLSANRKPPPLLLTLWSRDLRHQLRLASLAGADQSLVVLRDAGVDEDTRCFVTVHRADGQNPEPLAQLLQNRQQLGWLRDWKQQPTRARLWRGLLRIADGLDLLHSQQMLHRTLSDQSVLADRVEGPDTFRLSGFEWTVRLGDRNLDALPVRPPELVDGTFSRATDWFLYGVLCTKLLIGTPINPEERPLNALVERLRAESNLFDLERNLLQRLIDPSPQSRISRSEQIRNEIFAILARLEEPQKQRNASHLALIVDLGKASQLTRRIRELQEQEALEQRILQQRKQEASDGEGVASQESLPAPPPDQKAMLAWIEKDVEQASLVRSAVADFGTLRGRKLHYKVSEHAPYGQTRQGTWELAFTNQTWDVRAAGYSEDLEVNKLPVPVRVFVPDDVRRDRGRVSDQARSWKPLMTRPNESVGQVASERRFVDFLSLTNQIEALMHDAQIFGYEIVDSDQREETDYIALHQRSRDQDPPEWALRVRKSPARQGLSPLQQMLEDGRNEEARTQPDNPRPRVQLTESERLRLLDKVVERELWEVLDFNELRESCPSLAKRIEARPDLVFLRRAVARDLPPPMSKGFLRPGDHWRQTLLVARRQKAIEALPQHSYLLRALLRPDLARINTKISQLPLSPDKDVKESEKLDNAKRTALQNIWKTRPVFTLQGPPGTGKTTLVTALLRQIFAEDANAQVLVTAQAHPAVDTLRERVKRAYQHEPPDQHPLAIRMKIKGTSTDQKRQDDDYPEQVAHRLLDRAYQRLHEQSQRTKLQEQWYPVVKRLRFIDGSASTDPDAGPFLELLRRAANITYCTSTAGDLAVLATRTQSFDWCIIEEAAKANGHDLVLPLQLSYRWLLIGDHYQLKPYRHRDFQEAIADLPDVMRRLKHLMDRGNRLVDRELVQRWYQQDGDDDKLSQKQEKLRETCTEWLRFFEHIFKSCDAVSSGDTERATEQGAPLAQMLDQQHRMHPVIAKLVSHAFYESQSPPRPICSMTEKKGNPMPRVRHAFTAPAGIADKSLVWINVPQLKTPPGQSSTEEGFWSSAVEAQAIDRFLQSLQVDPQVEDALYRGEENAEDLKKLKLAVLSPYRRQVFSPPLRKAVRGIYERQPQWLLPIERPQQRPRTVDGYQGNEAAIVVVSLVRNNQNHNDPGLALGFLQEMERINVMFSRAERLLVLVGCWEFFQGVASELEQGRSLQEWPLIMNYLKHAFVEQTAIRIEMDQLPPVAADRGDS